MSETKTDSRGMSIFAKTFLTVIVVALIPVLTLGVRNIMTREAVTTAEVDRAFDKETELIAARLTGWLDLNIHMLQHDTLLPEIRSAEPERQRPVLHALVNSFQWITLASTLGADGKNLTRSDTAPLLDYGNYEYFRDIKAGKEFSHQVVIGKSGGKPALILAAPYPAAGGQTGVLMTGSRLINVTDAVAATKIGLTGFSFVLDDKGKVIAHRAPEFKEKLGDLSQHPAYLATRSAEKARVVFNENGKEIIAHARVTRLGWVVVVQQEVEEALAPVREATRSAIWVTVGVAAFALLVAYLFARALTQPILRLTAVADAISRGETSAEIIDTHRGDEIGGLARAIDRLRVSVDLAMKRLKRSSGSQA